MTFRNRTMAIVAGLAILVAIFLYLRTPESTLEPAYDLGDDTVYEAPPAAPNFPLPGQAWNGPGYVRGDANAPVTVVEFSDFGCPYCAQFATQTYPALHQEFVATGKVRWIYVPFVLGMFPNGDQAALAAECAAESGEPAFWKMHDALYETQKTWKSTRAPDRHFRTLAAQSGVDLGEFANCYATARPAPRIQASNNLSRMAGVRATPSFVVKGQLVEGALPLSAFRQLLTEVAAPAPRRSP